MKTIPLTQGKSAIVDDWNYIWLSPWKWQAVKYRNTYYATRKTKGSHYSRKMLWMHREIMQTPKGMVVDHRDHNGLNCLEENMRNCTDVENLRNAVPYGRSKYKGVRVVIQKYKNKTYIYISSAICFEGKTTQLGTFKTEEDAARAYDIKAKEFYGEFAYLNFKF